MATRAQLPPPAVPIAELRTPNPINTFFRELVDRTSARWQQNNPIPRGTLYADLVGADVNISKAFPLLYFLSETVPIGSNTVAGMTQSDWIIWNWATDPEAESSYNAEVSYLGDSVSNSVFARTRTVRRDAYDVDPSTPTGSTYTGLIGVEMITPGSSYHHAEAEYDCGGEDAQILFVISKGEIISGIVEKSGINFNADSQINIIGDGSGATCRPILQPVAAILTSQKKVEFADDDPRSNEFVKVLEVWELLPGPYIPATRWDNDLGPVQMRTRAVLNTGQYASGGTVTPTGKLNFTGRDGSSVVLIEIQENWSNGTGAVGSINPPYPILVVDDYERLGEGRGSYERRTQIVVATGGEIGTLTRNNGFVTKITFEPYQDNPYLLKRIIETWVEVIINDQRTTSIHGGGITNITERRDEPGAQTPDTGLLVVSSQLDTTSPDEQTKKSEILSGESAWPPNFGFHCDEVTGIVVNYVKQVIDAGLPYPGKSGYRGPFIEDQPYDRWKTIRITSVVDLNTLPAPESWTINHPVNFPPQLLSIEALWSDNKSRSALATASLARVSVSSGSSCDVLITSSSGYRGYAKGTLTRTYFYGPPNAGLVPYPLKIIPSSGSVVITQTDSGTGASDGSQVAFNDGFTSTVIARDIRDHLVGNVTIVDPNHTSPAVGPVTAIGGGPSFVSVFAGGTAAFIEVRIPQSNPPRLIPGSTIIMEARPTEWRFGIWVLEVISVIVP